MANCIYNLMEWEDKIYLLDDISDKLIMIDNFSTADIISIDTDPYVIRAKNIEFNETETLNERYRFETTLRFTLNGYRNLSSLPEKHYAAIHSKDGRWFLVNVDFEAFATYEYSLDNTVFTYHSLSNYPALRFEWDDGVEFVEEPSDNCSYTATNYELSIILWENFAANEIKDSAHTFGDFTKIEFNKDSLEVNETFDGNAYTQTVSFTIPYEGAYQYLLGEFDKNRYVAKVNLQKPDNLYLGTEFGLMPLYSVDGNIVTITFSEKSNSHLLVITNEERLNTYSHRYINTDFDPCIGDFQAQYLLRQIINGNGAPLNEYECLEGYETLFEDDYNIVGTFNDVVTYYSDICKPVKCTIVTDMPRKLEYYECWGPDSTKKNRFNFRSDCEWHTNGTAPISPLSGNADTDYTIIVTKYYYDAHSDDNRIISISAGTNVFESEYHYYASDEKNTPIYGLTNGEYNIDYTSQIVKLKVNTDLLDWDSVEWTQWELPVVYENGFIMVNVPENNTNEDLRLYFEGTCNNNYECGDIIFIIVQSGIYQHWQQSMDKCDYVCDNGNKCYKEYLETGVTSGDAVTTDIWRIGNVFEYGARECTDIKTKWEETNYTQCVDGYLFLVDLEYETLDGGVSWQMTGGVRLREQVMDADLDACSDIQYDWYSSNETICDND